MIDSIKTALKCVHDALKEIDGAYLKKLKLDCETGEADFVAWYLLRKGLVNASDELTDAIVQLEGDWIE